MDFLVLYKSGPEPTDLTVCNIIVGKKADEGEVAIEEAMTQGAGDYVAVPLSKALFRTAESTYTLAETPPPGEEPEEEEPA
jgi:hypothetical protein